MALATVAALAAAPKVRLGFSGSQFSWSTPQRHIIKGLHAGAVNAFTASSATIAAFGSNGTLCSKATTGFPSFPTYSGVHPYIYSSVFAYTSVSNSIALDFVDVVWACTGFSGASAVAQTIPAFPAYTRGDANGEGLDLYIFTVTTAGITSITVTVSYTNTASTAGRNAVLTLEGSALTTSLTYKIPLQAGDTGVQSIQSLTFSATSGSVGNIGLALVRSLAWLGGPPSGGGASNNLAAQGQWLRWNAAGLQQLDDDAALTTIGHSNGGPAITGSVTLAYG